MKKLFLIGSGILMASGSAFGVDLLAGSDSMPAGTVSVTKDGGMLEVAFDAANPLLVFEAHAAAGSIDDGYCDVPQNRKGNPKVGRFEEQEEVGVPGTDSLTLNVNNVFAVGETICVAAHAVVYDPTLAGDDPDNLTGCDFNDDDEVTEDEAFACSEEGAWGDGFEFNGNNWATWFEYCVPGDKDVIGGVDIGDASGSYLTGTTISLDEDGDASITGSVGFCGDGYDYYTVTVPSDGTLYIDLTGLSDNLGLNLAAYEEVPNQDYFTLANSNQGGSVDESISTATIDGYDTYVIGVGPDYFTGEGSSSYSLTIDFVPNGCLD